MWNCTSWHCRGRMVSFLWHWKNLNWVPPIKNISMLLDPMLSFDTHIWVLFMASSLQYCAKVPLHQDTDAAKTLTCVFVTLWVNYCCALLASLTKNMLTLKCADFPKQIKKDYPNFWPAWESLTCFNGQTESTDYKVTPSVFGTRAGTLKALFSNYSKYYYSRSICITHRLWTDFQTTNGNNCSLNLIRWEKEVKL